MANPKVKTVLSQDERTHRYKINLSVYSQTRPGVKANAPIDPGKSPDGHALRQLIGVTGGALAEYLCENHGDTFDPSEAAREMMLCFDEMMAAHAQAVGQGRRVAGAVTIH